MTVSNKNKNEKQGLLGEYSLPRIGGGVGRLLYESKTEPRVEVTLH